NHSPGSIKRGSGFQALQQLTFWRKDIHGTKAWANVDKILSLILLGKSYVEVAPDVLHIESNKVLGQTFIRKCFGFGPYRMKVSVENSDFAFVYIGYIEETLFVDLSDRRAG